MSSIKWDKRLETGIPVIDTQHKKIFKHIGDLELAILEGKEKIELIKMIHFIEQYSIKHFNAEEQMLREIKYPDLSQHRDEHKLFRSMCKDIVSEYQNKGAHQYLAIETDKKLVEWWQQHILKSDMFFLPFVEKSGWKYIKDDSRNDC